MVQEHQLLSVSGVESGDPSIKTFSLNQRGTLYGVALGLEWIWLGWFLVIFGPLGDRAYREKIVALLSGTFWIPNLFFPLFLEQFIFPKKDPHSEDLFSPPSPLICQHCSSAIFSIS